MLNIKSPRHLAYRLSVSEERLHQVITNINSFYQEITIYKKKQRKVVNVKEPLKTIQKKLLHLLYTETQIHPSAYGWSPGKSSIKNAACHIGHRAKLCIDIKDCFPNTHSSSVRKLFEEDLGCSPSVATMLTKLTTYKYSLPQGSVTSGYIINLLLRRLDSRLSKISNNLCYTRYGDDMTFSGDFISPNLKDKILSIIKRNGLPINHKKLQYTCGEKTIQVTGLIPLRKRLIAPNLFMKNLRAAQFQLKRVSAQKKKKLQQSITGRICYLKQIDKFSVR